MYEANFKIETEEETEGYGKFVLEPLSAGFGVTMANSLRRVLLTALPGAAIVRAEIEGAAHQFQTLPGLKEDLVEFILNLKKVRFSFLGHEREATVVLNKSGAGKIKAADLECPAGLEVINKDLYLGELSGKRAKIKGRFAVEKGFGYVMAEERESQGVGTILVDALFSPVRKVSFKVEPTRVGREANFDKLVLEIWTDGTIGPKEALEKAARLLVGFFKQVYEPGEVRGLEEPKVKMKVSQLVLKMSLEELELPTRVVNALHRGGIETVEELLGADREELMKIKNFGEKSLELVRRKLSEKGVDFDAET